MCHRALTPATRFRWWVVYLIPGLLLPPAVWMAVVLSRLPLSGVAPDAASLPSNVSLPPAYADCPVSNVQWRFLDSFTGVYVVVGDTDPKLIESWTRTMIEDGHVVAYGPVDSRTNANVFIDHTQGSTPKYTGTIDAKQYSEFFVGKDKIVIVSRK